MAVAILVAMAWWQGYQYGVGRGTNREVGRGTNREVDRGTDTALAGVPIGRLAASAPTVNGTHATHFFSAAVCESWYFHKPLLKYLIQFYDFNENWSRFCCEKRKLHLNQR